jgi:uncharacterized protein
MTPGSISRVGASEASGASAPSKYEGPTCPAIQLLIVQPTPFCNIQCDYCYLPERDSTARLDPKTFRELLAKVFSSGLVPSQLSVVWHAGEPLALPVAYYASLFAEIDKLGLPASRFRHSIQTNATRLTPAWCDFIREKRIHLGVSLDGPAFIHDRHRKDRRGRGSHSRAMEGVRLLRENGIDFHVIAVVTADAVDHADAIFDFFLELGVKRIGFNVEELEGEHVTSSLMPHAVESKMRAFWARMYERQIQSRGSITIREFENARSSIITLPPWSDAEDAMRRSTQTAPFAIISSDWQGNLSSFSPELLGLKSGRLGDFTFANIFDGELQTFRHSPAFERVANEIYSGVKRCASSCEYFSLCGGGAPSNKYFEHGTFDSTETMYCRTAIQMPIDIVLEDLERRLEVTK